MVIHPIPDLQPSIKLILRTSIPNWLGHYLQPTSSTPTFGIHPTPHWPSYFLRSNLQDLHPPQTDQAIFPTPLPTFIHPTDRHSWNWLTRPPPDTDQAIIPHLFIIPTLDLHPPPCPLHTPTQTFIGTAVIWAAEVILIVGLWLGGGTAAVWAGISALFGFLQETRLRR